MSRRKHFNFYKIKEELRRIKYIQTVQLCMILSEII